MKRITSGDNRVFKEAAQLKQKKYRDERRKYIIEGPNLIREGLQNGGEIELIILSEDCGKSLLEKEFVNEDFSAETEDIPMVMMPPGLFRRLSDTETPQGILAVVKKKVCTEEEFFSPASGPDAATKPAPSNVIVLDRLQDPGNIGTILRTADAAGYLGAILMKGTADIYSPKVVRAAAGSLFRLPVLAADTPEQAVGWLKQHGKTVVCTAIMGARPYYDADLAEDTALIIGNEGNGVCEEFIAQSDILVTIPMEGTIESLNAAAAAAILMYESVRQKHRG